MDAREIDTLEEKIQFYEAVLDNIYNGVMITDRIQKGRVPMSGLFQDDLELPCSWPR